VSDRFTVLIFDAKHEELTIHQLVGPLGMSIPVEGNFFGSDSDLRRLHTAGSLQDYISDLLLQLANIRILRIRPVVEFDNRPMVRVRANEKDVFNASFSFHSFANGGRRLAGRCPPQVETDNGDAVFVDADDQRSGVERIEHTGTWRVVAFAVTP